MIRCVDKNIYYIINLIIKYISQIAIMISKTNLIKYSYVNKYIII